MPFRLFSDVFIVRKGLSGTTDTSVVPAGFIFVIKQATFYASSTVEAVTCFLEYGPDGTAVWSAQVPSGRSAWFGFYGAIVIPPGGTFWMRVVADPLDAGDVYCGGYRLKMP